MDLLVIALGVALGNLIYTAITTIVFGSIARRGRRRAAEGMAEVEARLAAMFGPTSIEMSVDGEDDAFLRSLGDRTMGYMDEDLG